MYGLKPRAFSAPSLQDRLAFVLPARVLISDPNGPHAFPLKITQINHTSGLLQPPPKHKSLFTRYISETGSRDIPCVRRFPIQDRGYGLAGWQSVKRNLKLSCAFCRAYIMIT
jgi:hypothetical protein